MTKREIVAGVCFCLLFLVFLVFVYAGAMGDRPVYIAEGLVGALVAGAGAIYYFLSFSKQRRGKTTQADRSTRR